MLTFALSITFMEIVGKPLLPTGRQVRGLGWYFLPLQTYDTGEPERNAGADTTPAPLSEY